MRRFGSWVFRTLSDEKARDNLLKTGGLPAVLTWAILQKYDDTVCMNPCAYNAFISSFQRSYQLIQVTVWVSDPDESRFVFEVSKSEQSRILGDISAGRLSSAAESVLQAMSSPSYCENTKIKLIKIL